MDSRRINGFYENRWNWYVNTPSKYIKGVKQTHYWSSLYSPGYQARTQKTHRYLNIFYTLWPVGGYLGGWHQNRTLISRFAKTRVAYLPTTLPSDLRATPRCQKGTPPHGPLQQQRADAIARPLHDVRTNSDSSLFSGWDPAPSWRDDRVTL